MLLASSRRTCQLERKRKGSTGRFVSRCLCTTSRNDRGFCNAARPKSGVFQCQSTWKVCKTTGCSCKNLDSNSRFSEQNVVTFRLISITYGMMGLNDASMRGGQKSVLECLFVDCEGKIFTLNIPFHLGLW